MFERIGVGLSRVTLLEPVAEESAELVACIVTVLGVGRTVGAVYLPEESTVPYEELPPPTLLTDQATVEFVVPVTMTVNC